MNFKEFFQKPAVVGVVVGVVVAGCFIVPKLKDLDISITRKNNEQITQIDNNTKYNVNIDEAYEVILSDITLSANEFVNIELGKDDEWITFYYTFNDEYTEMLKTRGFTQDDIDVNTQDFYELYDLVNNHLTSKGLQANLRFVLKDKDNNVFVIVENGSLIEGNVTMGKSQASDSKQSEANKETIDDPMASTNGKHMENTAPYGRCPSCNAAHASDKGYQGDYCDDCYAAIKQKEYEEKHQYGDCTDCGVYLSKNQSQLYGGRCPDCYAKYYGDNDTHMGSCERCGERVDLDHTNDGWGYNHLCSACTGELQELENNAEEYNPYAG